MPGLAQPRKKVPTPLNAEDNLALAA